MFLEKWFWIWDLLYQRVMSVSRGGKPSKYSEDKTVLISEASKHKILQLKQNTNPTFVQFAHLCCQRQQLFLILFISHILTQSPINSWKPKLEWFSLAAHIFSGNLFEPLETFSVTSDSRSISAEETLGDSFDLFSLVGNLFPPGSKTHNTSHQKLP